MQYDVLPSQPALGEFLVDTAEVIRGERIVPQMVLSEVGEEDGGFHMEIDSRECIGVLGTDGDDRCLVGQYLPVAIWRCLADIVRYLFFLGRNQQKDRRVAFGKGMLFRFMPRMIAGKDKPSVAEITVVGHLCGDHPAFCEHRLDIMRSRSSLPAMQDQDMLDLGQRSQWSLGMVELIGIAMHRVEIHRHLFGCRLAGEGFVEQRIAEELFAHRDESFPESFVVRTAEEKDILRFEFFDEDILGTIDAGKTAGIVRIHFRHPHGGICDIDVMSAVRHKEASARTECFIGDGTQQVGCEGTCYTGILLIEHSCEMPLHAAVSDKEHRFVWFSEQELAQLGYVALVCQTQRSLRSFQDFRH